MPPAYNKVGGLIYMEHLDASGAPSLLTMGFRITDDGTEKWTRRFNRFKAGVAGSVEAGVRTMRAALQGTPNCSGVRLPNVHRVTVVGAISSRDGALRKGSPVWRLGEGIAEVKRWEWRPDLLQKSQHRSLHTIYNAAERDAEVMGRYTSAAVGGSAGVFLIADDFCTRGTTSADISRALIAANPGWQCLGITLAKTERATFWSTGLSNDHIPDDLDQIWGGD
ncbi:hypothetical protein FHS01_001637 [Longimicrobium terrae]|uniref:Phosphoribosyltransferase n=1 Tax=Longimicrobium terrae TaxID=1639882 RepID=A0A841GTR4_9BACT|nr:hypothetical protein [Longimicrobium terrae]MBB6070019.1 hypothetical protein [Longimicrobium terrae]